MAYDPVEDIPNIETLRVDFRKLNPLMFELITRTTIALNHRYNVRIRSRYESELRTFLRGHLHIYSTTHESIHILLKYVLRKKYYPPVTDAASLAREQIEKIYNIALVLTDPYRWLKHGLRGSWRKDYELYLLALEEKGQNPRYEKYLQKDFVDHLSKLQRIRVSPRKEDLVVSDYAKRVLKHYWANPVGKNPNWFRAKKSLRNWIQNYFDFPTPGTAMKHIDGKSKRKFLFRWYREYSHFSQYTHIGIGKEVIPFISRFRHTQIVENLEKISLNLMEEVIFTSFTAAASACTFIILKLHDNYGAKVSLKEFWAELEKMSLTSRALWNIYPKKIL